MENEEIIRLAVQLTEENNRIYCFGRWTGFKPNMTWSDDQGKTFSKKTIQNYFSFTYLNIIDLQQATITKVILLSKRI